MNPPRPHVFRLTDDEQAAVGLYHGWQGSMRRFAKDLGISYRWFLQAIQKSREILEIEQDKRAFGNAPTLNRAHGHICMKRNCV